MESSRWISLLVRAAAHRLLDPGEGCPLTRRYLLKEIFTLSELSRDDALKLVRSAIDYHASGAQILKRRVGNQLTGEYRDTFMWDLYTSCMDKAQLAYQQMGQLISPWDASWGEVIKKTKARIYDKQNEIGDTGLSDRGVVDLVKSYEALKKRKRREREQANESK